MNFFCALPKDTPVDAERHQHVRRRAGPYYVASRQVGRSIILKTNPNYKGPAAAQRRHVRLHGEHEPRPEPAAGQGGPGRLRRRRSSADGARRPRRSSSASTRAATSSTSSLNVDYVGDEHDPARRSRTRRCARRRTTRSTGPRCVRVRGYLAGTRNDQFLPPGIGGYKDFNIYPIKGANYAEGQADRLAGRRLQGRHAVHDDVRGRPAPGPGHEVQPQPDGLQRDREALPGLPDLHRGRHEG